MFAIYVVQCYFTAEPLPMHPFLFPHANATATAPMRPLQEFLGLVELKFLDDMRRRTSLILAPMDSVRGGCRGGGGEGYLSFPVFFQIHREQQDFAQEEQDPPLGGRGEAIGSLI